jgi:hypothetical protein
VSLSAPRPIDPNAPFLHAQTARAEDEATIESLVASGRFVPATPYRVTQYPSRPGDRMLPADHPLVIEARPDGLDDSPAPPFGRTRLRSN